MTMKLKLALALVCVTALTTPVAMAQSAPSTGAAAAPVPAKEFVAEAQNVPQLGKPGVQPMNNAPFGVPEPGSLPLVLLAALAAVAVARRKK